ncbi:hypothetical protein JCM10213_005705 [Rhodosporidiobolus nylandii]
MIRFSLLQSLPLPMLPPLPDVVLGCVLSCVQAEARRTQDATDLANCLLVSRRWARIGFELIWVNAEVTFSREEGSGQVGDVCQPIAVPYVSALRIHEVTESFSERHLHHFAPRLVWIDLRLVEKPGAGLRNLRICSQLEGLALVCAGDQRGLDSHLTHALILLFHSRLVNLYFELDIRKPNSVNSLLPHLPAQGAFPSLRNLMFQLTVDETPIGYLQRLSCLVAVFVWHSGPDWRHLTLDNVSVVCPEWSSEAALQAWRELVKDGQITFPPKANPLKNVEIEDDARQPLTAEQAKGNLYRLLEDLFCIAISRTDTEPATLLYPLWPGLETFSREYALQRGRALRREMSKVAAGRTGGG